MSTKSQMFDARQGTSALALLAGIALVLNACNPPAATTPRKSSEKDPAYEIVVFDYYSAAGFGYKHRVSPRDYSVALHDDRSSEPKQVWRTELKSDDREHIANIISNTAWHNLRDSYEDPDICDGFQVSFRIENGDRKAREIWVANKYQPELAELTDYLDTIVPESYRIAFTDTFLELEALEQIPGVEDPSKFDDPFGDR